MTILGIFLLLVCLFAIIMFPLLGIFFLLVAFVILGLGMQKVR